MSSTDQFLGIALAITALALLLYFFTPIQTWATDTLEEETCRSQVKSHALGLQLSGRQFASQITCGRDQFTVANTEQGKRKIAEAMRTCWYSFNEGTLNLFQGEHTFCHPCAVFTTEGSIHDFGAYLAETRMPRNDQSYASYLSNYASEEARDIDTLDERLGHTAFNTTSFEANTTYAAMFVYAKGQDDMRNIIEHVKGETTAGQLGQGFAIGSVVTGAATAIFMGTGWGLAVGATGVALSQGLSYFYSPEAAPEWIAMTAVDEYQEETLKALNCEYAPVQDG